MKEKLIITSSSFDLTEDMRDTLDELNILVSINPLGRRLNTIESVSLYQDASWCIAGTELLNEDLISKSHNLRGVVRLGIGTDNVNQTLLKEKGIKFSNINDAHVPAVAELALGHVLNGLRGISYSDKSIRDGSWKRPQGRLLANKVIGFYGFGQVAKHLAKLIKGFDCTISYNDVAESNEKEWADAQFSSLSTLFTKSDVVIVTAPLNKSTQNIIGKELLDLAKRNFCLIVISRGGVVNEEDLYSFLNENPESFAGLDVFLDEPYRGQFTKLDNVALTAHIGGYAIESRRNMERIAFEKVTQMIKDKNLGI